MTKFEVIAYETENGDNPVEKFLDKLNPKMRARYLECWLFYRKKVISCVNHTVNT